MRLFFDVLKYRKKILLIFVAVLFFAFLISIASYLTFSADDVIKVGVVDYTRLALRSGPGAEYAQIKSPSSGANLYVSKGDQLVIAEEERNSKGEKWYKVPCSYSETGYAYVYDDEYENFKIYNIERDPEFEDYLTEQGFPESYKDDLRILHYFYPKWEFIAVHNGLDWNRSVDAESVLGVSLVSASSPSSWKSTQSGAYNWSTGTWTSFDYGLHAASREIIEFYMDPRNSLGQDSVFLFLGQFYDDSQTLDGLRDMLSGTFMAGTVTDTDGSSLNYPQTIYNASKENGVNPYVISSIIINEVGSAGTSGSVSGNYSGYENLFNYFNINAYAHSGNSAIKNGLIYAGGSGTYGRPWNTRYKAVVGGIQWYVRNYVSETQISLYTKRFNITSDYECSIQYMTNINGASSEASQLATAYPDSVKSENVLKFYIPVFENMPETACKRPIGDGSPNNRLSSLSVSGYNIGPAFDMDTLEYSLIVPSDVSSVTISASAVDSNANISGTGTVNLNYGANNIEIEVTAENGSVRTYVLVISRQYGGEDPSYTTSYKIDDDILKGVSTGTKVSDFLSKFSVTNGSIAVTGKGNSDIVATGDRAVIYSLDSSEYKSFSVVIVGDVSGDGQILINDIIKIRNHLLQTSMISGSEALAADVSGDGQILINDIIKIRNHLLGTDQIIQ